MPIQPLFMGEKKKVSKKKKTEIDVRRHQDGGGKEKH